MKSILIVEDDITYGMILKTWLGKKGFLVSSASSIARAQKHIEAETVDLIRSDLRLPDRDGIDLLKWLGEHSLHIPLIIMTGYADIQSAVQAIKLGACDYIAKPVNPDELLKKMDEKKLIEDSGFPYGWNKGDTCVMITNKTKKSTCEYTVESYDGRYFGVRSHTGLYHRVSPWRMFRTREEAVETLLESKEQGYGGMTLG